MTNFAKLILTSAAFSSLLLGLVLGLVACSDSDEKGTVTEAKPSPGEVIWTKNCKVCHAQGINGAPIIGNKAMWSKRTPQGVDTLISHAISGYGLMPAKGGKTDLPDEEVALAVRYMLSQLE